MSILDDSALRLRAPAKPASAPLPTVARRVRFRPGSSYARDFAIPAGLEGLVRASYDQDGREVLNVMVEGIGYCTGVPAREMIEDAPDDHA
jgi:hypothetical protein